MKINHSYCLYCLNFFLFLFFIIPTYCTLIPNNRVIVYPNCVEDINLVEGIIYNIVNLKSGLNLNEDGDKVFVSSASNDSKQCWSLRKTFDTNGKKYMYNIINVSSGKNLDSGGTRTYTNSPEKNPNPNPYQHWRFSKIKDDTYNIVHVNSSRNLVSNGQDVYISTPIDDSYQQWSFKPNNYKLTAEVVDLINPPESKDKLDRYKIHVNILNDNFKIKNPSNTTIEQIIDKTEVKSNTYTLEIIKLGSLRKTEMTDWSFGNLGYLLQVINDKLHLNLDLRNSANESMSSTEETIKETILEEVSYHIQHKVTVPAFTSVAVNATADRINLEILITAKTRITGKADRLDESGNVVTMTYVETNALICYLLKENYDVKSIIKEEHSLIINTNGTLKIDGYGSNSTIEVIPINDLESPKNSESPKNPVIHYQFILFIFILLH